MFVLIREGVKIATNVQGFLLCWYFIMSSPELKPNRINDDEVKNKSSIEFGQPELLLIANKRILLASLSNELFENIV